MFVSTCLPSRTHPSFSILVKAHIKDGYEDRGRLCDDWLCYEPDILTLDWQLGSGRLEDSRYQIVL